MDISTMNRGEITVLACAGCAFLSMHFTVQLVSQHLFYWKNPKEQRTILFIILMAPVYAIKSFVSMLDLEGSKPLFMLLDPIKECYEALVSTRYHCWCLLFSSFYPKLFLFCVPVFLFSILQVIVKFLDLLYSYLNISINDDMVPDEMKGREIQHTFPMTLFQVNNCLHLSYLFFIY